MFCANTSNNRKKYFEGDGFTAMLGKKKKQKNVG
jgi:hypothetical protein